jgi:hypothetical protein
MSKTQDTRSYVTNEAIAVARRAIQVLENRNDKLQGDASVEGIKKMGKQLLGKVFDKEFQQGVERAVEL